ncbi:MerR family transcriptional regulator [Subtercola boreus]|uniref:MerR family transcriptional regulator n=1 Tax=Subtercola boreus TaxID=120213 RepID=A0A3E0VMB5_9MICO|nr:TipAS antibiotic-recognition domain-containing protein [Subtercola boreus]RFA10573.1 MerR family transcriptional regulator [Subtercola boreus]TQL55884.1 DNA-binding transcriptional MerR regulator [Subtercola boreus]
MTREWPIQQIAALAGTTSRTLRHYGDLGLLAPSRIGANGYRYYDQTALVRLQRILMLRRLGLGLPAVAEVLANQTDPMSALDAHLDGLRLEQQRIARQITAVEATLDALQKGTPLMAETMFDGFDHAQYEPEVTERWGGSACAASDSWWRGLTDDRQREFQAEGRATAAAFGALNLAGAEPTGPEAQALARCHVAWLAEATGSVSAEYLVGLGDLYVADDRFGRTYDRHGPGTAAFVRDALRAFAATLPA